MTVRIEKSGSVWTVILSRPKARNAMNPESVDALQEAFLEFEKDGAADPVFRKEIVEVRCIEIIRGSMETATLPIGINSTGCSQSWSHSLTISAILLTSSIPTIGNPFC